MLSNLSIRNVVLIEALDIDFQDGLTVLTGETGAGKSILLDALGLALGSRADFGLIRNNSERASVAAEFYLADTSGLVFTGRYWNSPRRIVSCAASYVATVNHPPI